MKRLSLTVKTLIAAALVLSASSCSEKAAETTTPAAVETSEAGNAGEAAPKSNISLNSSLPSSSAK